MTAAAPGEVLDWDTGFFGFRIGRAEGRLTPGRVRDLLDWSSHQRLRCLYFLAPADCPDTIRTLENTGFHLQDIRLTMTCPLPSRARQQAGDAVREARAEDVDALRAIARVSHRDSRFYRDPGFPRDRCDALYAAWIERSCLGELAAAVLTADWEGRPAGYITCLLRGPGEGQIGLFAVDAAAQGKGLGGELLATALDWFHARGVHTVTTVTQGANLPAQRVYQRSGFLAASVQLWYHRWQ
jgi:dTDP-4-amino-4,6-dideoxy-D-galactose acyltransferase